MTTRSWFSASRPIPPIIPGITPWLTIAARRPGLGGGGPTLGEPALAPGAGLEDHAPVAPRRRRSLSGSPRPARQPPPSADAAHPDGVDLVDEDDALAAPFPREPLRLARQVAHDDRVQAEERRAKPDPGMETKGQLNPVAIAFASTVFPVPGAPRKRSPRLALAARLLEVLAGLPEGDKTARLLLRLGLAAHVLELHAPVRVAWLVAAHLGDAEEHRAEEDEEVDQEEEEDEELAEASEVQFMPSHAPTGVSKRRDPVPGEDEDEPDEETTTATARTAFQTPRQNEARRRATTSSARSASSVPNRLGHGT